MQPEENCPQTTEVKYRFISTLEESDLLGKALLNFPHNNLFNYSEANLKQQILHKLKYFFINQRTLRKLKWEVERGEEE